MKRRMGLELVMVVAMILGYAASVQATLLTETTLDRLHDTSLWYQSTGTQPHFGTDSTVFYNGADLNDDEWPQHILNRNSNDTNDLIFEYRTESSLSIPSMAIGVAMCGGTILYNYNLRVYWASGNDNFSSSPLVPVIVDRGATGGGWVDYMCYYDLTGLNVDRVRITVHEPTWWKPVLSSVKLDVVPEPATMGLLAVGGVLTLLRKRR